jgi:hypothetical protein
MMETIEEVLQEVHKKYSKNTEYPVAGDDDFTFRLTHANDGIGLHEGEVSEGVQWSELIDEFDGTGTGTGVDDLADDFLATYRLRDEDGDHPAELYAGTITYYEVTPGKGMLAKRNGLGGNVFWIAGKKLHTFPVITGSFTLPYLRKETRYEEGTETTPIDMTNPLFLVFYILSMMFLKDRNAMGFNANQQLALEEMRKMRLKANQDQPNDRGFGIGT